MIACFWIIARKPTFWILFAADDALDGFVRWALAAPADKNRKIPQTRTADKQEEAMRFGRERAMPAPSLFE